MAEEKIITLPGEHEEIEESITAPIRAGVSTGERLQSGDFFPIRQNAAINAITKMRQNKAKTDENTNKATIKKADVALLIADPNKLLGEYKTSTAKTLDILLAKCEPDKGDKVSLTLSEYMQLRGLKDRKSAKRTVRADAQLLAEIKLSAGDINNYEWLRLFYKGSVKEGNITMYLTKDFLEVLKGAYIMDYPKGLLKTNDKEHPNSYNFGRKIAEHQRINRDSETKDIISVKTLLDNSENIPTIEEVMQRGRNPGQKIIEPFERDLDHLTELGLLRWNYCHKHGAILTDEELINLDYKLFETLNIKVEWINYPDQTKYIERKKQAIEKNKAAKRKRNSQKKTTPGEN